MKALRADRGHPDAPGAVVAETAGGRVRAGAAVVAVNAASGQMHRLRNRLTVSSSHIVLTEPVPDVIEALGWTGGEAITDGRALLHYFRTTQRRAHPATAGAAGGWPRARARTAAWTSTRRSWRRREQSLHRIFPALEGRRIDHAWGGPIDVSPTHLPAIVTLAGGRAWAAFGYTGNGVGPSHLAARSLASLALGRRDAAARWAWIDPPPKTVPPEPLRVAGATAAARGARPQRGRRRGRRPRRPGHRGARGAAGEARAAHRALICRYRRMAITKGHTPRGLLALLATWAVGLPALLHYVGGREAHVGVAVHFWLVAAGALVAAAASIGLTVAGVRTRDSRTVLLGTAFSTMTALLAIHGLATPGVLVGPNGVIALAGAASLPAGATVLALSALPAHAPPREPAPGARAAGGPRRDDRGAWDDRAARVEGIADRDDPRADRDGAPPELVRVARAVPALMAGPHQPGHVGEGGRAGDDALADDRVPAHEGPLLGVERARLAEDRVRDADLPTSCSSAAWRIDSSWSRPAIRRATSSASLRRRHCAS